MGFSENEKMLLVNGFRNKNKIVTYEMAKNHYKDESRARKTLKKLVMKGYLKNLEIPGLFAVADLPDEIAEEYNID